MAGVGIALNCCGALARLLAASVVPLIGMFALCLLVQAHCDTLVSRLFVGGATAGATVLILALVLMLADARFLLKRTVEWTARKLALGPRAKINEKP